MTVLIGAVAGWLAGLILKGKGMGFLMNAVVGIVGAFVGSYLFTLIGLSMAGGLIGAIITSTAGAVVLLAIVGFLKKSQ
ncbi:GlsB/YeaQ/YmgE family stress response membrane protein [sulfur-oxidizing endosymbiont of Gigantopelta aegis]|uniref:GlsB/YeaQ/YmgE family stress response membrane protein n=1 Tax=sulfur-oxidizing endosymbiont of Gigantopelta aegis TaxID=2794934 RepID=UPI0031B5EFFD